MTFTNFKSKYLAPLYILIYFELASVFLMSAGFIPREFSLFLLAAILFFAIFSPLKEGLLFFVFSIPFFTALSISESFDLMSAWRIVLFFLFLKALRFFVNTSESLRRPAGLLAMTNEVRPLLKNRLFLLVSVFFLLAFLSLLVAEEPVYGIKKIIFLANALAIFFVVKIVAKGKRDALDIIKFSFAGSLGALLIGYGQFISTLFLPLYDFWQWWALHVIPVFYGHELAGLLSYSNTWFSYYEEADATLRMFSVFPDSHSFALSMLISLPIAIAFFHVKKEHTAKKLILGGIIALYLMSLIFSGTRGVWLGAIPIFFASIALLLLSIRYDKIPKISVVRIAKPILETNQQIKIGLISILIFFMLFPVASQLLQVSQALQGGKSSSSSAFTRISTSLSRSELSNKGRIEVWESTFKSISERPWLGVGIGNYPVVLGESLSATKEGASAHSLYLDVVAEMGILGGIVLILIFLEIYWRAIKTASASKNKFFSLFSGLFAVYFLWIMAYSVVDVVLLNDKVLLLFLVMVGLIYSISIENVSINHNRRAQ